MSEYNPKPIVQLKLSDYSGYNDVQRRNVRLTDRERAFLLTLLAFASPDSAWEQQADGELGREMIGEIVNRVMQ